MAAPAPAKKKDAKKPAPAAAKSVSKKDAYKVDGNKAERIKPTCPKCGPGTFMATHKDRVSCGKCGYTEFKKKE
jgi:small subunit ribosomal protein S27Ae